VVMKWEQAVGVVRRGRIHLDLKMEMVRWCRIGLWDETWDFCREDED
jgi:hypothetical protein